MTLVTSPNPDQVLMDVKPELHHIEDLTRASYRRSLRRRNARAERINRFWYYVDRVIDAEVIILLLMLIATAIYAITEVIN